MGKENKKELGARTGDANANTKHMEICCADANGQLGRDPTTPDHIKSIIAPYTKENRRRKWCKFKQDMPRSTNDTNEYRGKTAPKNAGE